MTPQIFGIVSTLLSLASLATFAGLAFMLRRGSFARRGQLGAAGFGVIALGMVAQWLINIATPWIPGFGEGLLSAMIVITSVLGAATQLTGLGLIAFALTRPHAERSAETSGADELPVVGRRH
ncbi:hypothetical protein N802_18390 [Knoellia sinensis KCTC 19936]|uniref:Uncharacterized protein n=1 Tax=Knoellia sinensis KCTC 19936 TaxID=1385520 RepID=A0A0A0J6C3_9MICO|nr:hypothetical protein [Knoellia sinensis]KGN32334.1 hypothetical protein N802_18390 [Knoellia sinensis KCTC 19936]